MDRGEEFVKVCEKDRQACKEGEKAAASRERGRDVWVRRARELSVGRGGSCEAGIASREGGDLHRGLDTQRGLEPPSVAPTAARERLDQHQCVWPQPWEPARRSGARAAALCEALRDE